MKYINKTKSVRFLSVKQSKGVRLVRLNVGAGELSDEDALAVVVKDQPTSEAVLLAKNGLVHFDHKELSDLFEATQKKESPFAFTEKSEKPAKAAKAVEVKSERPA